MSERHEKSVLGSLRATGLITTFLLTFLLAWVGHQKSWYPLWLPASPTAPRTGFRHLKRDDALTKADLVHAIQHSGSSARVDRFMSDRSVRFFPRANVLVIVPPKTGSTSLLAWVFRGLIGREFDCGSALHSHQSECWEGQMLPIGALNASERVRVLTARDVMRVAVWRDPFERLVSAWKSKFTCATKMFRTDFQDQQRMAPRLRKTAGLDERACFSLGVYAETLESIRKRLVAGVVRVEDVNAHLRPLDYLFDCVSYDLVMNIESMSNATVTKRLADRFGIKGAESVGLPHLHASTGPKLVVPADAAELLRRFARLTKTSPAAVR